MNCMSGIQTEREEDELFVEYYGKLDKLGENHIWNVWSCQHKLLEIARRHGNIAMEAEIGRRVESITKVLTR